jgi:hypothetical protein
MTMKLQKYLSDEEIDDAGITKWSMTILRGDNYFNRIGVNLQEILYLLYCTT